MAWIENEDYIITDKKFAPVFSLMPGDDEDDGSDDDWSDIDDEDFEDMAEDADDFHEMQLENDLLDPEDEDHLPDDDME